MTLYKYILNEIWPTFFVALFVMVFIMMASQMLPMTELIITRGVRVTQVLGIVIFLLPDLVAFALPAVWHGVCSGVFGTGVACTEINLERHPLCCA